jgi:hypothetical protein
MKLPPVFVSPRARMAVLSALFLSGLAACVTQEKADLQCEPGVADLSRTADVAPGNC